MTYIKPEVLELASSIKAIQGSQQSKPTLFKADSSLTDHREVSIGAYEADE